MSRLVNLVGQSFNRWTVIARAENSAAGQTRWLCRCTCGNEAVVQAAALKNNHSKSCGCLKVETTVKRFTKHGYAKAGVYSPTYGSWAAMVARCTNPNHDAYPYYGGSGIKVCQRWLDFSNFIADLGEKPEGYSIERRDVKLGYEPGNCYWATLIEQARNKRTNTILTVDGISRTIAEWSEKTGVKVSTISWRLQTGKTAKEAIALPRTK